MRQLGYMRNDALAGDWRGTDEEPDLALTGDDDGADRSYVGSQLHQNDRGCQSRDRHERVHHNAQLAVVCVRLSWVEMNYLSDN
jgi:hypothetical protein